MSDSSTSAGADEAGTDRGGGPVVVLLSAWWKNPFLWMALGLGIPLTILAAIDGGEPPGLALLIAMMTVIVAGVSLVALDARLEIRPNGFREQVGWRTIEHRWTDVSAFAARDDPEAQDAVVFLILKNGRATGEYGAIMGAYGGSVAALTDRMNAAREQALGPAATARPRRAPGQP